MKAFVLRPRQLAGTEFQLLAAALHLRGPTSAEVLNAAWYDTRAALLGFFGGCFTASIDVVGKAYATAV